MSEETKNAAAGEELSEILRVRREKLDELQKAGRDPFRETKFDPQRLVGRDKGRLRAL